MAAVLKWMFVLVLLIAVAGSGAAYWFYTRSDEGLRLMVLQQLKATAPNLKFDVVRAHFDIAGRVRIYGMTAALPDDDDDQPSLEVPEMIVTLESSQLPNFEFVVQKLYVVKPKVRVRRNADGTCNWQQVKLVTTPGTPLPELDIEHASIPVEIQFPDRAVQRLNFESFNVTARPADSQRFLIQVATLLDPCGPLTLEVEVALDGSAWKCESRDAWRVPVNEKLFQLLADLSPDVAAQLATAGRWMSAIKAKQSGAASPPARLDALEDVEVVTDDDTGLPDFGVRCTCELNFWMKKEDPDRPLALKAKVVISNGEINNGLLPFSLREVSGKIYIDNRQIIVDEVRGSNGPMKLTFDGGIIPNKPIHAKLTIRNVELNQALKARLPEELRRPVTSLGLTGVCDADLIVIQEDGTWKKVIDLRLAKGTVTHERFPVTVRDVAGKLHLENKVVEFNAVGRYAGQPVEAYGTITNPGPEHHADIVVKSNNLPLDDESLAACPVPVFKAIEALKLKGRHNLILGLSRKPGIGEKYEPDLRCGLFDGTLCFNGFPYTIQQLSGIVRWKGDLVTFENLKGIHDGAKLTGSGRFLRVPGPGRLELTIDTKDGAFDRSLEAAIPPMLRQVWHNFQPVGNFDAQTNITWVPGQPCNIVLPIVKVRDGEVLMTCFPWPLRNLRGEFSYNTKPGRLVMKEIHAQHDDTQLSASGVGWFSSQEPWRLVFEQINVDNLTPNVTFRNALPEGIRRAFDFLRPAGAFSFYGPVEFSGPGGAEKTMTAAWKLKTVLSNCALNAGGRIDEINGAIQLDGTWDGTAARLNGQLDLDSISIFRQPGGIAYHITGLRGPIAFSDGKFVAGTESAIPPRKSDSPDETKRVRGEVIDGKIYLDAAVTMGTEPAYRAFVELKEGRLERYAQQYLRGKSKLAGVMNGYMNVIGKGTNPDRMTGGGKLVIAPAALYEFPLFVQLFQMAQFDRTAFEQANLDFTVGNSRFDLNSIKLEGETFKMGGSGYVRFDGGMQLDFGLSRRQLIPNPFKPLIAVKVTGNVGEPRTRVVPLLELDDSVRQFFDPRRMSPRAGVGQTETEPVR